MNELKLIKHEKLINVNYTFMLDAIVSDSQVRTMESTRGAELHSNDHIGF